MPKEETALQTIRKQKDNYKNIIEELNKEYPSPENDELRDNLMWQIQSIEASMNCTNIDEYTVYWVLRGGFDRCPLRLTELDNNRSCVEVDCPRFDDCELTLGVLDRHRSFL
jgi:hypothetical protein